MKCANHPHKEAVTKCSLCKRALCDSCAEQTGNNEAFCARCAARVAARDASVEKQQRTGKQEAGKASDAGRRKGRLNPFMVILIVFAVFVSLTNAYLYFNSRVAVVPEFNPNEDLEVTAVFISEGISKYMADHGGDLPENLEVLSSEYFTEGTIPPEVLEKFAYIVRSDGTYQLRLKDSKENRFPDMVFGKTPS